MKAIAVFCVLALFAITFVQCEKPSFGRNHHNLTHNKTGLPHFAHHNRTIQVPHFPKFNKTHGVKPTFPHFNKTVLRHALRADEAEEDELFFWRQNKTQTNKTHHANKTVLRHALKADEAEEDEFFFWGKNKTAANKTHPANKTNIIRRALKADEAEDEELFSFFGKNNKTHQTNKTHGAKPFSLFPHHNKTHNKTHQANKTHGIKPAFPKFNKTVLRHALKADEAEEDEFFFWRRNRTETNKTHHANKTSILRRAVKADEVEEDEFFFRRNKTHENRTHHHANRTHHNRTHQVPHFPKFNKTHGIKPVFPKFNKTNILRRALKADEAEDEELFSFFRRPNKTHQVNKTHHANKTGHHFPHHNLTHTNKTHTNKTHGAKPFFPRFGSKAQLLRHALKADEAEDEELFSLFRRNATVVAPKHHNKTHHHANNTVGFARHNLTHPTIHHKNHTNKGFLKF